MHEDINKINKFPKVEPIQAIIEDHNEIKVEIKNKK